MKIYTLFSVFTESNNNIATPNVEGTFKTKEGVEKAFNICADKFLEHENLDYSNSEIDRSDSKLAVSYDNDNIKEYYLTYTTTELED